MVVNGQPGNLSLSKQESIKDLACKASTVTTESGEAAQDYYMDLLKVQVMGVKFSNMPLQIHGRTPFQVNLFLGWHLNWFSLPFLKNWELCHFETAHELLIRQILISTRLEMYWLVRSQPQDSEALHMCLYQNLQARYEACKRQNQQNDKMAKKNANKKGKINVGVVIGNMQNLHEMQKKGKKRTR